MTALLFCVPPPDAGKWLPIAEPLLASALDHTGVGDIRDIRQSILQGNSLLWLATKPGPILAAASTQLQQAAIGKVCVITACGGNAIREWLHLIAEIEAYATAEGCEVVRYFGRKGWLKELPAYEQIGVIADRRLGYGSGRIYRDTNRNVTSVTVKTVT